MNRTFTVIIFLIAITTYAQNDVSEFAENTVEDVTMFGKAYANPAAKGVMYNLNSGWYNSAKAKDVLSFEVSVVGNVTFIKRDESKFTLNTLDYNNVRFEDGSTSKEVPTIFGENEADIVALIDYNLNGEKELIAIELPNGIDDNVDYAPNVFLQASIGVFEATEVKVRFAPKIMYGRVEKQLYGFGLQHEFSKWFSKEETFPVYMSVLVGYTKFNGFYDVKESGKQDENQGIDTKINTWNFAVIGSTKFEKLNFYAGLAYLTAKADTKFDGVYQLEEKYAAFQDLVNNFSVENNNSGISGTFGANYKLSNIVFNLSYNIQEFSNVTFGVGYFL